MFIYQLMMKLKISETMHQVEKKLKSEGLFKILQG